MKNILVLTLLILLVSCNNPVVNNTVETIRAEPAGDQSLFFTEFVNEIEIVPLDNKKEVYLADTPELIVYNSEYYIYNRQLFVGGSSPSKNILLKFDSKGKFLGYIGDEGVGLGKYRYVANFCISKDTIYIFTSPDFVINKFKLTGEFIEKKTIPYKYYMQALKFGDEYLLYLNFNTGVRDERLVVMNKQGTEVSAHLPIKTKASPWTESTNLTFKSEKDVLIREIYNDTIYSYTEEKGVIPRLVINFAEKSVPKKEYLESEGKKIDIEKFLEQPSSCINIFFESAQYLFFEILDNTGDIRDYKFIYAIKNKNSGIIRWFDFEKENKFLRSSFQFFDGNKLYCLASPSHFDTMTDSFKSLVKNPEMLKNIKQEDNQILVIITLK